MAISGRGKVAIVTGASSGIGEATAIALAEAGFRLALGARRVEKLSQVAARIERISGEKPLALALDVTCTENVETYVQNVLQRFGKVHVLVNNAGKALGRDPIDEVANEADWQEMIDTNVMGLLRMTRRLVPHLIASGEGHIVNIGSTAGHEAYAAVVSIAVRNLRCAPLREPCGRNCLASGARDLH
ncbi:hypothetical protein GCM10025858_30170 [Alicyclobacillus sacchari]|uniref:SDR family oxidoreductase n=1 Tax=Alicyclobacillus sacchari TaxID=392010 RepID=UPI0023E9C6D1|nr:SDR family NAD(P)-dependent oxidoreductase [Alicyclobacillus sacchari]GMA58514.1 hypothetical protein GCM10025858_30170 [Alicyclobacillus sacchari]